MQASLVYDSSFLRSQFSTHGRSCKILMEPSFLRNTVIAGYSDCACSVTLIKNIFSSSTFSISPDSGPIFTTQELLEGHRLILTRFCTSYRWYIADESFTGTQISHELWKIPFQYFSKSFPNRSLSSNLPCSWKLLYNSVSLWSSSCSSWFPVMLLIVIMVLTLFLASSACHIRVLLRCCLGIV